MDIGNVLVAALVGVLSFVVLFAIDGWASPPGFRGNGRAVRVHRLPFKFSLRTVLFGMTLVAIFLGLMIYAQYCPVKSRIAATGYDQPYRSFAAWSSKAAEIMGFSRRD